MVMSDRFYVQVCTSMVNISESVTIGPFIWLYLWVTVSQVYGL